MTGVKPFTREPLLDTEPRATELAGGCQLVAGGRRHESAHRQAARPCLCLVNQMLRISRPNEIKLIQRELGVNSHPTPPHLITVHVHIEKMGVGGGH